MSHTKKIAVGLVVGLPAICCLGGFLVVQGVVRRTASTMPQDLAELRRQGFTTEPEDLKPLTPATSPDQNAAPIYRKLAPLLKSGTPGHALAKQVDKGLSPKAVAADHKGATEALAKLGEVMTLAEKAGDLPACDFRRDWSKGFYVLFPEYTEMKTIVKLLAYKAERQSQAGDWRGALASIRRAQRIGRHAGEDPVLISSLVQIACESIATRSFRKVIDEHDDSAAFLQEARKVHAGFGPLPDFRRVMGGELVLGRIGLRSVKSWNELNMDGSPPEEGTFDRITLAPLKGAFEAKYVHEYRLLAPDLPKDPEDWGRAMLAMAKLERRVLDDKSPLKVMNQIVFPVFTQAAEAVGKLQADRRVTETSLRLLQARLTGPLPKSLPADPKVSGDPFGTGPLRYVRNGRGFTVYSLGPDRVDDGGAARSTTSSNFDLAAKFK